MNLLNQVWNWSNLISEERVKFYEQKQWKRDENRLKNKEVMTLWSFTNFKETFLDQSIYMQMSELMMSSPHNFPFVLYTEMKEISYFSYENVRLALITLWIDAE